MKVLIVYSTYYESTEKCAYRIKEKFQYAVMINASLDNEVKFIDDYDAVIIGSPVHAGKIHRNIKKFLKKYEKSIQDKKIYFFYCGIDLSHLENIEDQFPDSLKNKIEYKAFFGGEIVKSKLNGFDKMAIEMVEKQRNIDMTNYNSIDNKAIEDFIDHIK